MIRKLPSALKRILDSFAIICFVGLLPISAMAQVGLPKGGGGSGGGTVNLAEGTSTTSGFQNGEVIYSDGTVIQGIQMQALLKGDECTSAVGTDAYACSPAGQVCPASLATSPAVVLTTDVANTGAATFAYCGLAAKAIVKPLGAVSTVLADSDMFAAAGYLLAYNATGDNWKILSNVSGNNGFDCNVAGNCDLGNGTARFRATNANNLRLVPNTSNGTYIDATLASVGGVANTLTLSSNGGNIGYTTRFLSGTTIPTVGNTTANSCGTTAATISGTGELGIITVGATSGTSCDITHPSAAPTRRVCHFQKDGAVSTDLVPTYVSTTVYRIAGTFAAGQVISYQCNVY